MHGRSSECGSPSVPDGSDIDGLNGKFFRSMKEYVLTSLTTNLKLDPDAAVDLHMHTTYSDGRWPAQQLIDYLVAERFDLVAVTDHDRVDKVAEIQELAAQQGLPVLSGVEVS